jgi:hypothetical protein
MNGRITAEELYHSRKEEIERMAEDEDSPLLREYARKLIELVRGDANVPGSR